MDIGTIIVCTVFTIVSGWAIVAFLGTFFR